MISTSFALHSLAIVAVTVLLLNLKFVRGPRNLPLPPGPKGYPIVGNLYDTPKHYPWLTYAKWKDTFGPVFSTTVFGKTTIVINSHKAATDLLDKRSTNYSSRPRMIMVDELLGWDWNFAHMPYSEKWRRHRRVFHQYFQERNLDIFNDFQKKSALGLLGRLSASPNDFLSHIRQYVGSVVLHAAYGYEVASDNDFYIQAVEKAIEPILHAVHSNGSFLVEFFPFLKHLPWWFPGAGFNRHVKSAHQKVQELRDTPFQTVKALMAEGTAPRSFVSDNLEKMKSSNNFISDNEEETLRNSAAIVYLAGTDSSVSLIAAWVLAMARHPEAQKKAQQEIDRVIGGTKMPESTDIELLPYCEATILETLRWHSIAPLVPAVPHQAVQEDEYDGYRIPAGATITINTWAILHDEEVYSEPHKFNPDRFLRDGKINFDSAPDPTFAGAFGYGRRICPGRHLAMQTARTAMLSILATYNISSDAGGKGVPPMDGGLEVTDGVVSHPAPFAVQVTPRSEESVRFLEMEKMALS